MHLETKEDKQLTKDKNKYYASADWSPDGNYIAGVSGRRNMKLHLYHKDGGSGAQLIIMLNFHNTKLAHTILRMVI
jgi:Tol biopolymer transport system component